MNKDESNLTTKDLSYVTDIFNWNINCYNAFAHFGSLLEDEQAQKIANKVAKEHKNNCEKCLKLLK